MRDWSEFDDIYTRLFSTVYAQPEDPGHTQLATKAITWMMTGRRKFRVKSVLDFGCGTGFCQPIFESFGVAYTGIAYGEDVRVAKEMGRNVMEADFNFLNLPWQLDAGIARHSLEHSPFPILTLRHWSRFIRDYLLVVLPAPEWYMYKGQNHFSVMPELQAEHVFDVSGFEIMDKKIEYRSGLPYMDAPLEETKYEYWYLLKKLA